MKIIKILLKMDYIFDMETGDPDDLLTLLFLCSSDRVNLKAVTLTPGTNEQVSMVAWILKELKLEHVKIGAHKWPKNQEKQGCMRGNIYKQFGKTIKELKTSRKKKCLTLIHNAMTDYLKRKPDGKKLHDPLALATSINPKICKFAQVEIYKVHKNHNGVLNQINIQTRSSVLIIMIISQFLSQI